VVHPIDDSSPLYGWTRERLLDAEAEFLILITAIDETFAQTVHSRSSYTAEEVEWGVRFVPLVIGSANGSVRIDMHRFHATEPAPLDAAQATAIEAGNVASGA
jgi:inward rectifier potassium channel